MRAGFALFRRVNLRYFTERRLRTALTVAGVAAGVGLVFSISVINATLVSSVRSSIEMLAGDADIEVAASDPTGLSQSTVDEIEELDGVDKAVPALRSVTRVTHGSSDTQALFLGATLDFASLFPRNLGEISDIEVSGGLGVATGGVILSEDLADSLNAGTGDVIQVETPTGHSSLRVAGFLSGGGLEAVNGGAFGIMSLPAAQEVFQREGRVDSIYVVGDDDTPTSSIESEIENTLDHAAVVGPPGERGEVFERTFSTLHMLTTMAGVVALFVALFVVYNTMSMSVTERRREISLALSLGVRKRQVFGAFLAEAAVLGVVSAVVGIAGGFALASVLVESAIDGYRFVLPETTSGIVTVDPGSVLLAGTGGLAVSLLGAFIPVRRVLTVAPIEFLKPQAPYEWQEGAHGPAAILKILFLITSAITLMGLAFYSEIREPVLAGALLVTSLAGVTLLLPWAVPFGLKVLRPFLQKGFGAIGRLAVDALEKNWRRTTMTVAALLLTLGMVIGVGSAIESLNEQITRRASGWFGAPLYVNANSYNAFGSDQPLPADLESRIERVEGVEHAYPGRYGFVNVGGEQAVIYAIAVVEAAREAGVDNLSSPGGIDRDEFIEDLASGGVVVSRYTARRLGLDVGDEMSLPTPAGRRDFTVRHLMDDLVPFDSMYMEYETYRRFWGDEKADRFAVLPAEGASTESVRARLQESFDDQKIPAEVLSRTEVIGDVREISEGLISIARGIQLAALIVAALTIANTMFIAVLERRWEFGLQRAMGMGRRELGLSVLLESGSIGIIGAVGGLIMGTAFGFLMLVMMEEQFYWRIPFEPQWALMALGAAGGVAIAAAAGVYPRRIATRVPIVECLRYE